MGISKIELMPNQEKLASWISNYPNLLKYWDFETRDCDLVKLKAEMQRLSPDENIMARFFVGVWLGVNTLDFDVMTAVATLNDQHLVYIKSWINEPFWP